MSLPVAGTPPHAVSPAPGADARALVDAVEQVVHGRRQVVELAVATMLAGGHLLIEDVPGSGQDDAGPGARERARRAASAGSRAPPT